MPRNTSGLKRGGQHGRIGPNKTTVEVRAIAQQLVSNPEYVEALNARLKKGTAGAVEPLLWHYAYGKPVDTTAHVGADGKSLTVTVVHEHHD